MSYSELLEKSEKFGTRYTNDLFLDILYGLRDKNEISELMKSLENRFNRCLNDPRKVHYLGLYRGLVDNCQYYLECREYSF